ncbi:DedA family protein [Pseudonocardia zijingensis]|uniref:VTT domain-containing protein n=1 Tax=Pseudonocardia zijingensis TaxID=153376 RepID=A0ABN1QT59_9PSEU
MLDGLRLVLDAALASQWLLLVIACLAVVDALLPMVPSEALIITAGVGAAAGDQSLLAVIAAASLGSFIGEFAAFLIGRGFGGAVRARLVPGTPRAELFGRTERLLTTRGGLILLTARYIPAGRTVAALAAGASRFPVRGYTGYSAVGATMSAAYVALLGFLGGAAFAGDPIVAVGVSLGLATAIGSVAGLVRRLRTAPSPVVEAPPAPVVETPPAPTPVAA